MSVFLSPQAGRGAYLVCANCKIRLSRALRNATEQKRWITRNHINKIQTAEAGWLERAKDIQDGKKKSMLDLLEERGYVNQIVGTREELNKLLTYRRVGIYAGIDPTAPSMHVGHMVPFMALSWMFIHGYTANFLLGGATSRIGDPTDRLTGREVVGRSTHNANVASMHMQLKRFGVTMEKYAEGRGYVREWAWRRNLINNATWYQKQTLLDFLRTMGSKVRVGPMLGRDTVKNRLEKGDGMSFAEFTYPLVQAWDWWELYQRGVQIQIGGADQFGNILAGAEAVKAIAKADTLLQEERKRAEEADKSFGFAVTEEPLGFTVPLLTTSTGEKFGKSAGNAVWLDKDMTSVFDLYQFFLRSADADVEKYLRLLTFLPLSEISKVMQTHGEDESKRVAQHTLAREFVELVHGKEAATEAESQHRQLFKKTLTLSDIESSLKRVNPTTTSQGGEQPSALHPSLNKHAQPQTLHQNASTNMILPQSLVLNTPLTRILHSAGLVASRSEANRLVSNKGVYIGGRTDQKGSLDDALKFTTAKTSTWEELSKYLIDDKVLILRTGKWRMKIITIVPDSEYVASGQTCPGWDLERGVKAEEHSEYRTETRRQERLSSPYGQRMKEPHQEIREQ